MNAAIIMQIRAFRGYAYETAGLVNGFFEGSEEAKACGYALESNGAKVEICGCQLTAWNA